MSRFNGNDESILFCNEEKTVILLDIPRSIAEAQLSSQASTPTQASTLTNDTSSLKLKPGHESSKSRNRARWSLLSAPPLEEPYPVSTEPKTESARRKVLSRTPPGERQYHDEIILPLVTEALSETQNYLTSPGSKCCLPRVVRDEQREEQQAKESSSDLASTSKKRKIEHSQVPIQDFLGRNAEASDYADSPPIILSPDSANTFPSLQELAVSVVKNPSSEPAVLSIRSSGQGQGPGSSNPSVEYFVPPHSSFVHGTLPLSDSTDPSGPSVIPGLRTKFNLILFDPPWPNRSVKRSRGYQTHAYNAMEELSHWLRYTMMQHGYDPHVDSPEMLSTTVANPPSSASPDVLNHNSTSDDCFGAIWITNSEKARRAAYTALMQAGHRILEEWVWVKVTASGDPVYPANGIWRKPYEILVIGRRMKSEEITVVPTGPDEPTECTVNDSDSAVDHSRIRRRVIAAVPDVHSRKPNLKSLFERILFRSDSDSGSGSEPHHKPYAALEVFARNLTAEWTACGNEVLKFNARDCWVECESV